MDDFTQRQFILSLLQRFRSELERYGRPDGPAVVPGAWTARLEALAAELTALEPEGICPLYPDPRNLS